jgi:regulator of protease activity HflC (stomatin/prohibitin superfamily)
MGFIFWLIVIIGAYFFAGIRIVNQYERKVVLTFGKYSKILQP